MAAQLTFYGFEVCKIVILVEEVLTCGTVLAIRREGIIARAVDSQDF